MNRTAQHTGVRLAFDMFGREQHSVRIVFWIFSSYAGNPELLSWLTVAIVPSAVTQTLKLLTSLSLPARPIASCVVASGTMLFSPAIRLASSAAGATTAGATGAAATGGGAGGDAVVVATGGIIGCAGGGGGGATGRWVSGSGAPASLPRLGLSDGVMAATRVGRSVFGAGG